MSYVGSVGVSQDSSHEAEQHVRNLSTTSQSVSADMSTYSSSPEDRNHLSIVEVISNVQKDSDDTTVSPTSPRAPHRQQSSTLTRLSRLFATQTATSPVASRPPSYMNYHVRAGTSFTQRSQSADTSSLVEHIYSTGLLSGKHSDITVHAFGQQYHLHRLILAQAPFFSTALSEPWLEAHAKEMHVHPEAIDTAITQAAFELALQRLYGLRQPIHEDEEPFGLFATGCWLEMQDLVDASVETMLRQMRPETLGPLFRLATNNYYGLNGERLLASAKAMLCRDGSAMSLRHWDSVPVEITREIVGGDSFFVEAEFERWLLAKRLLNRRIRRLALAAGLIDKKSKRQPLPPSAHSSLLQARLGNLDRTTASHETDHSNLQPWIDVYAHLDVQILAALLEDDIHYVHLDFEQLQYIRAAKDFLGVPLVDDKVISDALWQQVELRQLVMNVSDRDLELGLSVTDDNRPRTAEGVLGAIFDGLTESRPSTSGHMADQHEGSTSRRFRIPMSDCNMVIGSSAGPLVTTHDGTRSSSGIHRLGSSSSISGSATRNGSVVLTPSSRMSFSGYSEQTSHEQDDPSSDTYTTLPPFRFSVEFSGFRSLKEKKRVYSRTVFYAGSLWNVYIQKVATARSKQLGVYLHRAKIQETEQGITSTIAARANQSTDGKSGMLESEMVIRNTRHRRWQAQRDADRSGTGNAPGQATDDASENASNRGIDSIQQNSLLHARKKSDHANFTSASSQTPRSPIAQRTDEARDQEDEDTDSSSSSSSDLAQRFKRSGQCPTLPPYIDTRPTIKTYFKIYSPSRGGRMLSVYESAPDRFNFSQSWGWKSSNLMLDEGLVDEDAVREGRVMKEESEEVDTWDKDGYGSRHASTAGGSGAGWNGMSDGKLRFMVVLGNV